MCPFSILAFLQPTTVDKEPIKLVILSNSALQIQQIKEKDKVRKPCL